MYCPDGGISVGSNFDDSILRVGAAGGTFTTLTNGKQTVGAADSSTSGYTLTFKADVNAGQAPQDCVISLMDQRNWGGCVDVKLLPASAPAPTAKDKIPSECDDYCLDMGTYCVGALNQFTNNNDCLKKCANYTRIDAAVAAGATVTGNNFECRRAALDTYIGGDHTVTLCSESGPVATTPCKDDANAPERPPSPCWSYCTALAKNCAAKQYFPSVTSCLQSCADLQDTSLGWDASPPSGDNVRCRLHAAQTSQCDDAAFIVAGVCAPQNPLKELPDVLSATYTTLPSLCENPVDAAANTIAGCCCVSGTITLIHVMGSRLASVSTNLTIHGGQMCQSGSMTIPQYDFSKDPPVLSGAVKPFDFPSAVEVNNLNIYVGQPDNDQTSQTLVGSFTFAGDPFKFQLLLNATGTPTILLTNNVPSTQAPRVCSVQAAYSSRIDSTGYAPPPPGTVPAGSETPGDGANTANTLSASPLFNAIVAMTLAALVALMSNA